MNFVTSALAASHSSSATASPTASADKTLDSIIKSPDILEFLVSHSFKALPPSKGMIMSALWATLNTSGSRELMQSDVEKAVREAGGNATASTAFWAQLNPDRKKGISAHDFTSNDYLNQSVSSTLKSVREAVEQRRQEDALKAGTSNSLLDFFAPHGGSGSVLDFFI